MVRNVIVLGSGPAGLTAAVYTARANLNPLMISGLGAGGQLMLTTDVENYPGFPKGILGPELMDAMRQQAERFGTESVFGDCTKVDLSAPPFKVYTEDKVYETKSLIISTGAKARLLGLDSEKKLMGHGVTTCAVCDAAFFKGKEVVVIGGGDSAAEEATYLTKFANQVTLIHRREELKASKIMAQRVFSNPKIKTLWNTVVEKVLGEEKGQVTGVTLKDVKTGQTSQKACDGVFVAIGHIPNTSLFKGQLEMDDKGYLLVKPGSTATNVPGVFACGDVVDHVYMQAVTAAGTGCMAAIDAERYLAHLQDKEPSPR